jgi:hypothetical protein
MCSRRARARPKARTGTLVHVIQCGKLYADGSPCQGLIKLEIEPEAEHEGDIPDLEKFR